MEVPFEGTPDLIDVLASARDAGLEAALIEHPEPDSTSLVGVGLAAELIGDLSGGWLADGHGNELGRELHSDPLLGVAKLWRDLCSRGVPDTLHAVAIGGFAFRRDRQPGPPWAGFPPVLLRVPRVSLVRKGETSTAVLATLASEAEAAEVVRARLVEAMSLLELGPGSFTAPQARRIAITSPRSAGNWQATVSEAASRLAAGTAEKVVLAREVLAHADGAVPAGAVLHALRAAYPACLTFMVPGADGTAMVGATPELLIRRKGTRAVSRPMAGSAPRGRDPVEDQEFAQALRSSDKDQREHAVVVREVAHTLGQLAVSVSRPESPEVVAFSNIHHLATTITAELDPFDPAGVLELCAAVHPTPAVAGFPRAIALELIDELEQMERGWYSGAVGWVDGELDGEFALALRCGLLWEDGARVFAGVGIMPDSDPAAELSETEMKLRPLLAALSA